MRRAVVAWARALAGLVALAVLAAPATADPFAALRSPGAIAIMRHAIAPGTGDPANFALGDCSTQRNLDDRGRAQARAIGMALREAGITFDAVLSSEWCRSFETGELMGLGPVEAEPILNSFFEARADGPAQTEALRALLADRDGRLMLVTHQVNITALTGRGVASGEIFVIRERDGRVEVLDEILIAP